MSSMGVKIDQFHVPVCDSFQAKILNDQLCYEVDLEKFKSKDNLERDLESGLSFVMDYNEDRQVDFNNDIVEESNDKKNAIIYLNTIGSKYLWVKRIIFILILRASQVRRRRRIQFECFKRD